MLRSREPAPHRNALCCFPPLRVEKKLSVEMEKELSTCRKLSLIEPPGSRCSEGLPRAIAAPRSPLLQKRQARRRKNPCCRKSPLQPQKNLSACAESQLLPARAPPFQHNSLVCRARPRQSCWKTLRPGNATKTGARS